MMCDIYIYIYIRYSPIYVRECDILYKHYHTVTANIIDHISISILLSLNNTSVINYLAPVSSSVSLAEEEAVVGVKLSASRACRAETSCSLCAHASPLPLAAGRSFSTLLIFSRTYHHNNITTTSSSSTTSTQNTKHKRKNTSEKNSLLVNTEIRSDQVVAEIKGSKRSKGEGEGKKVTSTAPSGKPLRLRALNMLTAS